MKLARWLLIGTMSVALAGCATAYSDAGGIAAAEASKPPVTGVELTTPPERDPSDLQVLFWNDAQRSARFREMEKWFAGHEVPAAKQVFGLKRDKSLSEELRAELKGLMDETNVAGLMVLRDGKVLYEGYGLGMRPWDRWTSFSVAKSFTSTLLGAAIKDGYIDSIDDPVTKYIPGLAGSAYDGVTVRHIATMTSGVKWNEDYTDPNSDVALMNRFVLEYGPNAIVEQMKRLERDAEAGEKFVYKTGETNLLGLLVENATGVSLAEYSQSKLVEPAGLADGLFWMTDPRGGNIGGCCLSITLSDYARIGEFVRTGGKGPDGKSVVPDGWFEQAGAPLVDFGNGGFGYGYQWWTYPDGNFGAQGIFGQAITIVPEAELVVAIISNWPTATSNAYRAKARGVVEKIAASGGQ